MSHLLQQVSRLPELGIGVVYVPGLESFLEARPDLVRVIEVEPSSFWIPPPPSGTEYGVSTEHLRALGSRLQPKLIHGVGFPPGGSQFPDPRHLTALVHCIENLSAPWASEHLSFNEAGPPQERFNTGFLLPPLQTAAGVSAAVGSIRRVADAVKVPFAVETGVNYLTPRTGQLRDSDFIREVCESADCGILLDLHNIWTNERNGRESARNFIQNIPLDRVWEIHVAGGLEHLGFWLDAHSGAVPVPVLELANEVVPQLRHLKAIIFEILPTFLATMGIDGLSEQMLLLDQLWATRNTSLDTPIPCRLSANRMSSENVSPTEWENSLGAAVIGRHVQGHLFEELAQDAGTALIKGMVREFRAGSIVDSLTLTSRLVMLAHNAQFLRKILHKFWDQYPPQKFAALEAQNFAVFLRAQNLCIPYLTEVLDYEEGLIRAAVTRKKCMITLWHEPKELLHALENFRIPSPDLPCGLHSIQIDPGDAE